MTPSEPVRVEVIREAVRLAVEARSLRAVAREVRMSPMGLRHVLNGRNPYKATLRKLTLWFITHGGEAGAPLDVIRAAIHTLLEGLPDSGRASGTHALLAVVEQMHRTAGTQPPPWLAILQSERGDES